MTVKCEREASFSFFSFFSKNWCCTFLKIFSLNMHLEPWWNFPLTHHDRKESPVNVQLEFQFRFLYLLSSSSISARRKILLLHNCCSAFTLNKWVWIFWYHKQWRLVAVIHYVRKQLVFELLPPLCFLEVPRKYPERRDFFKKLQPAVNRLNYVPVVVKRIRFLSVLTPTLTHWRPSFQYPLVASL